MNETLIAIILGIVEGITEFLPISSTGHMILVSNLLGYTAEKWTVFEVFIQLGAILSIVFLYRDKFANMLHFQRSSRFQSSLTVYHVLAGIIPVMGIGYLLHKTIKAHFSPLVVIIGLILGGILMLVAEKWAPKPAVRRVDDISLAQAFWVGLFQCLALWPGFSRSGSTISGGMFFGLSRTAAADFSFIIAVPVMLAACLYDLLKELANLSASDLWLFAIGFVISFIVAYFSVVWLLRFLNKSRLTSFAVYRFFIAAISTWYFWSSILH